jgi:hypothetical protein
MKFFRFGFAALVAASFMPGVAGAQQGSWLVAPYLWASNISWDISSRGDGNIAFSDLTDKIDSAGIIRVEYARDQFGVTFDYIGISLSDRRRITAPGQVPINIDIQSKVDTSIVETGGFWRPSRTDSGVDILAGLRFIDANSDLIFTPGDTQPQRYDAASSATDIYVGARYLHRLTETWDFSVRGDYGFGGTEGAVNIVASLGWRSGGAFGMALGYRHLAFDIDERIEGESATNEYDFTGPALGFMFRF